MRTRRIDIGGIRLTFDEHGVGGRPLVLAHGFTGSRADFADWVHALAAAGWHVVVPDHRGHGESDKPEGLDAYSLDRFAGDIVALADALGFDRFTLLGHSMGGMLSQLVALAAPHRLEGLVLMDTHHGPLSSVDPNLIELGIAVALEHGMDVVADFVGEMAEGPLTTPAGLRLAAENPERAAQGDRLLRSVSPYMYAALLREISAHEDRLDRLAELGVPTLVVVGEQDRPFLGASRRMAEVIPAAVLAVIPEAGHSPQLEAPEEWWAAVSTFLDELASPGDEG